MKTKDILLTIAIVLCMILFIVGGFYLDLYLLELKLWMIGK